MLIDNAATINSGIPRIMPAAIDMPNVIPTALTMSNSLIISIMPKTHGSNIPAKIRTTNAPYTCHVEIVNDFNAPNPIEPLYPRNLMVLSSYAVETQITHSRDPTPPHHFTPRHSWTAFRVMPCSTNESSQSPISVLAQASAVDLRRRSTHSTPTTWRFFLSIPRPGTGFQGEGRPSPLLVHYRNRLHLYHQPVICQPCHPHPR